MTTGVGPRETPSATWEAWILIALADLGRPAQRREVHAWVLEHCGGVFTPADQLMRLSNGKPTYDKAWQNNLDSAYDRLKKDGLMVQIRQRAPWTLAPAGQVRATFCRAGFIAAPPPPADGSSDGTDLLRDFKPGNGSAYRMYLEGRTLTKRRDHEPLLAAFAVEASKQGWRPTNQKVHPRDLVLERGGETWLVEVKVLLHGNAVAAVREAVAQLLEYSFFWYPEEPPSLVAVFNEEVGDGLVRYLGHLGIEAVWWDSSGSWLGTPRAALAGLSEPA